MYKALTYKNILMPARATMLAWPFCNSLLQVSVFTNMHGSFFFTNLNSLSIMNTRSIFYYNILIDMADNNQQIEDIDSMDVQTLLNIATHNNAVSYMAQSALMLAGKAHFDDWLLRPAYGQSNRNMEYELSTIKNVTNVSIFQTLLLRNLLCTFPILKM
ncbi:MAG: hypothetical protein IPP29_07035 [Bacteroidetes bacterium]|nr:hypothetical protein [Bacteroidota bacterium]